MKVQCYDRDFFKSNDLIGEDSIDLKNIIEDVALAKRPLSLTKDYYEQYLKPVFNVENLEFTDDG